MVANATAIAQERAPGPSLDYLAKVICGTQPDPENLQLVRGRYLSAVNLLNRAGERVEIRASVALAHPADGPCRRRHSSAGFA